MPSPEQSKLIWTSGTNKSDTISGLPLPLCFSRDYGKKCSKLEFDFDETNEKLVKVSAALEEKEKSVEELEADISALARRIMLMEEENKKAEQSLADTVIKLALSSKVTIWCLIEHRNLKNHS